MIVTKQLQKNGESRKKDEEGTGKTETVDQTRQSTMNTGHGNTISKREEEGR